MSKIMGQMKENSAATRDVLEDFARFSKEISKTDQQLSSSRGTLESAAFPPVRNTVAPATVAAVSPAAPAADKPKRIAAYDYRAWDQYDADEASKDVDLVRLSEEALARQMAESERQMGNAHFKAKRFDEAIQCYTQGLDADHHSVLLLANRALAYIRVKRFAEAEEDCTRAVACDPKCVKAYGRRAQARTSLGNREGAIADWKSVLKVEPTNSEAKTALAALQPETMKQQPQKHTPTPSPVSSNVGRRAVPPGMVRLAISEVGEPISSPTTTTSPLPITPLPPSPSSSSLATTVPATVVPSLVPATVVPSRAPAVPSTETVAVPVEEKIARDTDYLLQKVPKTVPKNAVEFQKLLRQFLNHDEALFRLIQLIPPARLTGLLSTALDMPLIVRLVRLVHALFPAHATPAAPMLRALASVRRFPVLVSMASSTDQSVFRQLYADADALVDTDDTRALLVDYFDVQNE